MEATEIKKIGKYEITGVLGRGGMGVVYRAEDKRIGRLVAIKTLTEGYSGQPEMLERFYREAQAGILQHPNIVIVYDLGDQDGVPFIVMEHVNGEPLDKIIASGRQLPLIDRLSVIEQVCTALGYAHQRGVVHRDIKPANVIVQPDGHAKIVDFGIARVQSASAATELTRTGNVIGTVHYIAPERLKGEPFDGRSDIFSTGVMLYLLLAGRLPFDGEDISVLQKLVNEPHPPLSTYLSNYPPALDAIIDRALAKDPSQRYSTAEEFAVDLRAVGEDLKKSRVSELFDDAERLTTQEEFGRAREVLLQLVRIDSQHTGAKQLLGIVQQHLARMQRAEQVRQLVAESDQALASSRFAEAIAALEGATKLDPENTEAQAKLVAAKETKRRHDEIGTLTAAAEAAREMGDFPNALKSLERALHLDQQNTRIRALYAEFSKQAKLAAQQEQIRAMLGNARQEISSHHFTSAIEILREVGKLDPSLPELENLLQTATTGQEQERRRKLLDQVQAQIESCLLADDYDRATDLVTRAVEQLPTEASLLQLKTRVTTQARQFRVKQLIDSTASRAQEIFARSPHEALQIVQSALKELPGEERLLSLENSLRQRMKALETEEVRTRYLREAQEQIDHAQFEKAISTLESYRLEFADDPGVNKLLEFARGEMAQQQRRNRVATCAQQAKALMQQERFTDAITLLEPACAETKDAGLAQLLDQARGQQAESARRLQLLKERVTKLRERGKLDEAIELLAGQPVASEGAPLYALLTELRADHTRSQAIAAAAKSASDALAKGDFHAGSEALQSVRRAYGESDALKRAVADFEAARATAANQAVEKSVEAARTSLLGSDPAAAMNHLRGSADWVEFAAASQQADWRRLKTEAAKPVARKAAASAAASESFDIAEAPAQPRRKSLVTTLVGVGLAIVVAVNVGLWWYSRSRKESAPQPPAAVRQAAPIPAMPSGTLMVKANTDNAEVFVDGLIKGFTQSDGSLAIPLDPGPHSVRLVKPGYDNSAESPVTITNKQKSVLQFDLAKSKTVSTVQETQAYLSIHSIPGATVTVNNSPEGKTDNQGNLIVPVKPGKLSLQVSRSGYVSVTESMNAKAGERPSVLAMLSPVPVAAQPRPAAAAPAPQPVQIVSFAATNSQIEKGDSTTLKWETANASEVSINNGIDRVDNAGQTTVRPAASTSYILTAKGAGGVQERTVNIVVEPKVIVPAETPAAEEKAAPVVNDSALVREAVGRFRDAYNAHDMGKMRAVWTGMSGSQAHGLQNFFKGNPGAKVQDNCPASALSISGSSAEWTCNETTTLVVSGRELASSHEIRFSFVKKNGAWYISERR